MSAAPQVNLHATALVLGERGLLITGASGSGKTSLALHLLASARPVGAFAAFVCDDQVFVHGLAGRVIASAPETIAGLVEIRGFGPAPIAHLGRAVVDRVVELVPEAEATRFAEPLTVPICGHELPLLRLERRNAAAAALAIFAWLGLPPFAAAAQCPD